SGSVFVGRRDKAVKDRQSVPRSDFVATIGATLDEIQRELFERALRFREERTREVTSTGELEEYLSGSEEGVSGGFAVAYWVDDPKVNDVLAPLKATARCIPLGEEPPPGKCIFTGRESRQKVIFAKAY
ncbi:MAG TPA: proline--tRNA ligase, partial [Planctomycetota bacterium]|nr:proline--tRNA ligase [Planctomycetota bacterium]